MIDRARDESLPIMLTEFGGIALSEANANTGDDWGYSRSQTSEDLLRRYEPSWPSFANFPCWPASATRS